MILRVPEPQLTKPNKIVYGGQTLIDLTEDTVTPETLKQGVTAHDAAGEIITGTLVPSGGVVQESDINFYDYDGTLLHAWTLAELAAKTALPELPTREGLVCQGWNWTLAELKEENGPIDVGANYITDDGKTRIYIHLEEGRTSPMLGIGTNGTILVDWGDGSTPDALTGENAGLTTWSPTHNYPAAGDYVIQLTRQSGVLFFNGEEDTSLGSCLLRHSAAADERNSVYRNAIKKIEIGDAGRFSTSAFAECAGLESISIPKNIELSFYSPFGNCKNLRAIVIGAGTAIGQNAIWSADNLRLFSAPKSVTAYGNTAFYTTKITRIRTRGITSIGTVTYGNLKGIRELSLDSAITAIPSGLCQYCDCLASITIHGSISSIGANAFLQCRSLVSITIPGSPTIIGASAFSECSGMKYCDFTACTAIPTLHNVNAFTGIPSDCEIRVPASLVDDWKAATNWATYADHIVGVSTT